MNELTQANKYSETGGGRIVWIDIAKGIGVLLVVLAHTSINPHVNEWIGSFHMPLFVYLSGCVFKKRSFGASIVKGIKSLLIPYLLFSITFTIIEVLTLDGVDTHKILHNIIIGQGYPNVLWFLFMLFWVEFIYGFISHLQSKSIQNVLCIIITAVGMILCDSGVASVFSINTALVALFFFFEGASTKKWIQHIAQNRILVGISVVFNIVCVVLLHHLFGCNMDMHGGRYNDILLTFIAASSGIVFISAIAVAISRSNNRIVAMANVVLRFIGQNTIWFYPMTAWFPPYLYACLTMKLMMRDGILLKLITKAFGFALAAICVWIAITLSAHEKQHQTKRK